MMWNTRIFLFVGFLIFSSLLGAQVPEYMQKASFSKPENSDSSVHYTFVRLRSFGFSVGYYQPEMDFWNEQTIWKLGGSAMAGVSMELDVFKFLVTQIDVSYFNTTKTLLRNQLWGEEQLSVSMIPVSLSVQFPLILDKDGQWMIRFGGGVSVTHIINSYRSPDNNRNVNGATKMPFAVFVLDRSLGRYSFGTELRYILGSYTQSAQLDSDTDPVRSDVDISGPYAGINLKYLF